MDILYADTDAKFRNDVLSNTKHMIERIRGATGFMTREIERISFNPNSSHNQEASLQPDAKQLSDAFSHSLQSHKSFVEWYVNFLLGELVSTASYQRHITALKAIYLLVRSGVDGRSLDLAIHLSGHETVWPFALRFFTPLSLRLLLDLLLDPFEDVRSNATAILKLASKEDFTYSPAIVNSQSPSSENTISKIVPLGILQDFIQSARKYSERTGRADYADGVARSYELLYSLLDSTDARIELVGKLVAELEAKVRVAEINLAEAVLVAPIHNDFASLR